MPKLPQLKIAEVPDSEFPFEVNVSATLSETGKRQRKRFKSKGEANGFVAALKRKQSLGIEREILLPGHVKKQALHAYDLLSREFPEVSLLESVEAYVAARRLLAEVGEIDCTVAAEFYSNFRRQRRESVFFSDLMDRFRDAPAKRSKKRKSEKYRSQINWVKKSLAPAFAQTLVCDIDSSQLERAVTESEIPAPSVDAAFRVLRAAFNFAKKKGWLTVSPVEGADWFIHETDEARVPTPAQARALVESAGDEMLP